MNRCLRRLRLYGLPDPTGVEYTRVPYLSHSWHQYTIFFSIGIVLSTSTTQSLTFKIDQISNLSSFNPLALVPLVDQYIQIAFTRDLRRLTPRLFRANTNNKLSLELRILKVCCPYITESKSPNLIKDVLAIR